MSKLATVAAVAALATAAFGSHAARAEEAPKNPDTALNYSLAGTGASVGLMILGASSQSFEVFSAGALSSIVTPSFGQWYAGKPLTAGMGLRAAGIGLTVYGVGVALACLDAEDECHTSDAAAPLLIVGVGSWLGGTIYDIATAKSTARAYNNEHHLALAPLALRTANGPATGIGLSGTF